MTIIYFHGFSSAGSTGTATELRNHFYPLGIDVLSPDIPVYPNEAVPFLKDFVEECQKKDDIFIIGTSMGAMYADLFRTVRRILVNPSFTMSRSLTFNHLNKNVQFQNPRKDGATQFKVDKEMVEQFKALEKSSILSKASAEEKALVWGLFGKNDKMVNFQKEFQKTYGKEHFKIIDAEHHLNGQVLKKEVIPLLESLIL